MKKVGLRRYTAEERERAIVRAGEIGPAAAGRELNIPSGTVSRWQFEERNRAGSDEPATVKANASTPTVSVVLNRRAPAPDSREKVEEVTAPVLPRQYSTTERKRALARAKDVGPGAAGRELGIPPGTIAYWQHQDRRQEATVQGPEASAEVGVSSLPAAASTPPVKKTRPVAKVYTPSERARALECVAREGISVASRTYGISRFTLYDWRRQVALHAAGEIARSPVVGGDENPTEARDRRILTEWKAHPGLGPSQVRNQMHRQGLKVSLHTVRCVLEAHGYVTPKSRRQPAHDQLYEAVRPNHLWHVDFLHRHIHKQKVYVLLFIDDHSRFIVGAALWDGERVAAVQETFLAAVNRHGRPEKLMSDGGSAFYAWKGVGGFTRLLDELEVDQLIAKTPNVNGKLEVLNANIQKELFNQETFFDLGETQRRFLAWVHFYNFRRTHHALGGLLVPADRYFGRSDEVLAHIEAGRSAEGVGEPIPPGERQLDLLRVSSHRGQVELYLLGHRIPLPVRKTD